MKGRKRWSLKTVAYGSGGCGTEPFCHFTVKAKRRHLEDMGGSAADIRVKQRWRVSLTVKGRYDLCDPVEFIGVPQ